MLYFGIDFYGKNRQNLCLAAKAATWEIHLKIRKIHIDGFGKLRDIDIEPGEGITVFGGRNEAGKSTLHLFIRSILYGASTKRRLGAKSVHERMCPWNRPEIYRGRAEVEFEQQRYMIERDFNKAPDDLTIMELGEGSSTPVAEPEELMKRMLNGLTETAYINTVSAGQLGTATQKDMANELRKYSANIGSTMNPKLSADKALKYLEHEKDTLNAELDTEAPKEYNRVLTELKRIDEALRLPENENRISEITDESNKLGTRSNELSLSMAEAEKELDGYKETLLDKGFAGESEINGLYKSVHDEYDALNKSESKAFGKAPIFAAAAFFIIAGAASFYGYKFAADALRLPVYAAAVVCLLIAVIICARISSLRNRWKQESDALSDRLKPYIGGEKPGDESLKQFDEYIANANLIAAKMNELKAKKDVLGTEQHKLNDEYAGCLDSLTEQQSRRAEVEKLLENAAKLRNKEASLVRTIRNNKLVREKLEAVQLAEETLTDLALDIKSAAGTYINNEASKMIAAITNHAYDSISAGQSYDIELNSKDGMIAVGDMSAGTADQVYLAIRLATVRFITGKTDPLPLILDDSFNLYDDERIESSLSFLAKEYQGQMMIFTCQTREESVLDKLGIAYKKIEMG